MGWRVVDHFNQSVFHPLGVELYRKILGRSTQIGCHWFVFFCEEYREKGIGVAMGGGGGGLSIGKNWWYLSVE